MTGRLLGLARWIAGALLSLWSLPAGLMTLWAYATFNNGGPLWTHPAFTAWLGIEIALIAIYAVALVSSRRYERRSNGREPPGKGPK